MTTTAQVDGEDIPEAAHIQVEQRVPSRRDPGRPRRDPAAGAAAGRPAGRRQGRPAASCSSTSPTRATSTSPRRARSRTTRPTRRPRGTTTPSSSPTAPTARSPSAWWAVHSMEHGRIEIQYSPDLPEEEQLALKGVFDQRPDGVLLVPELRDALRRRGHRLDPADGLPEVRGRARRWTRSATSATPTSASGPEPLPLSVRADRPAKPPANLRSLTVGRIFALERVLETISAIRSAIPGRGAAGAGARLGRRRRRCRRTATCRERSTSSSRCRPCARPLTSSRRSSSAPPSAPGPGRVSFRSGAIVAPERFDLAGLAGEMRPLRDSRPRLRRTSGATGSRPRTATPVYFGGADELQVRARGWRPSGTLHYVNVSGTTSTASSILTGAREAINSAFISTAGFLQPAAEAAAPRPTIVTRSEWGADLRQGGCPPRVASRLTVGFAPG